MMDKELFFVIDSNNLQAIETKLYGYVISSHGIIRETEEITAEKLEGRGAYIYIEREKDKAQIHQDFVGSFGLYLYEDRDYFAVSNSYVLLLDHVKHGHPLSINRRYMNHYLYADLCTYIYEETAVDQIRTIDRRALITIDIPSKTYQMKLIDFFENTIDPDSEEGLKILDEWFESYTSLFRSIREKSSNIQIDLSGGINSRITFMLYYLSGADTTGIKIRSMDDGLHYHNEDYEIAAEIAADLGLTLNLKLTEDEILPLSQKETMDMSFYPKLFFHKQMYFNQGYHKNTLYHIAGSAGECIRNSKKGKRDQFILREIERSDTYFDYDEAIYYEQKKLFEDNFDQMKKTEKLLNRSVREEYRLLSLYRESICRWHFGKQMVENDQANIIRIAPLLDPALSKLRCESDSCSDKNLLIALIYERFFPEMLAYRIQGKKEPEKDTIDAAKAINEKKPYLLNHNPKLPDLNIQTKETESVTAANSADMEDILREFIHTNQIRRSISGFFNKKIYETVCSKIDQSRYHPLSDGFALIAIAKTLDVINDRNGVDGICNYIEDVIEKDRKTLRYRLKKALEKQ